MSIGAQAQSVESQALTTISTQHEEPTLELTEAPVSTESDYLMNFAEAAPRRRGYYGGGSAPYYSGTLELGFTSADRLGRMELLGSFGTLVSPTIYLGGGLGFNGYFSHKHRDAFWMLPLFVNFRATLPTNSVVKPFLDIKPGTPSALPTRGCTASTLRSQGVSSSTASRSAWVTLIRSSTPTTTSTSIGVARAGYLSSSGILF